MKNAKIAAVIILLALWACVRKQTMVDIGAAFTDASAEVFARLPEAARTEFMTACYDPEKGIGYNFSRTTIRSLLNPERNGSAVLPTVINCSQPHLSIQTEKWLLLS